MKIRQKTDRRKVAATAFAVTSLCLAGAAFSVSAEDRTKMILDCDMGFMNDDALMLSLLIVAEDAGGIELLVVMLESGNSSIEA